MISTFRGGGGYLTPPLVTLTGVGVLCNALQAELGDLAERDLQQLMEDLQWEIALCKLHAPLSISNQLPWGKPLWSSNYWEDEPEVTFPRGEGGIPWDQPPPTPALV